MNEDNRSASTGASFLQIVAVVVLLTGCENSNSNSGSSQAQSAAQRQTGVAQPQAQSRESASSASPLAESDADRASSGSGVSAPPTPPAPDSALPPRISFPSTTYDFGTFSETETRSASIIFTNTGGQTLVIESVKTSCGCTSAEVNPKQYPPGASGRIELKLEPTGPGTDPKYVNVISNSQPDSLARLELRANILPFLVVDPKWIDFKVLPFNKEHHFSFVVSCPSDDAFRIDSLRTTNPLARATIVPSHARATSKAIDVAISPTAPWGGFVSFLEITATGRPAPDKAPLTHTSKIRIQGFLFGQLQADPDAFRFGVKPGERFERTVRIFRPSGEPFTLHSATVVSSDLPGTSVSIEKVAPHEYRLIMRATARELRQQCGGVVAIVTDVPGEERINIPISGVVWAEPRGVQ
jgi:hypothetical protein